MARRYDYRVARVYIVTRWRHPGRYGGSSSIALNPLKSFLIVTAPRLHRASLKADPFISAGLIPHARTRKGGRGAEGGESSRGGETRGRVFLLRGGVKLAPLYAVCRLFAFPLAWRTCGARAKSEGRAQPPPPRAIKLMIQSCLSRPALHVGGGNARRPAWIPRVATVSRRSRLIALRVARLPSRFFSPSRASRWGESGAGSSWISPRAMDFLTRVRASFYFRREKRHARMRNINYPRNVIELLEKKKSL